MAFIVIGKPHQERSGLISVSQQDMDGASLAEYRFQQRFAADVVDLRLCER